MNRRDFMQQSSVALIAVAGLPRALRQQKNIPSLYKTDLEEGTAGQTYYEIGLYHSTIQNFAAATDEEKFIGVKVNFYETTDQDTATTTGEFKYLIKKTELTDKENNIWKITTKLDSKVSGDYKFPKEYPKSLTFLCRPYLYVNILGKKDVLLVSVPYPPAPASSSGGSGCFLTTACVTHKGFADNCEELTTLRFLRDQYMLADEHGREMISDYKKAGPAIVNAIDSCDNKEIIYEYMYRQMIVPSVELVQQGQYETAVFHYKEFVKALITEYC